MRETFLGTNTNSNALKIYLDSEHSAQSLVDISTQNVVGKLDSQTQQTINFYWVWEENPAQDQVIAENYNGFTISSTVYGEQTQIADGENINYMIKNK